MDIKILDKSDRKLKLRIKGVDFGFMNALRRAALSMVPTMAIDKLDVERNSSGLYDEIIAQRLGMVPIKFPDTYNTRDDCSCEDGCAQCENIFVLEKQGPCLVKSGDLVSSDEEVSVLDKEIPIVQLLEGQELKLEATAIIAKGQEHSKHQGAVVGYRQYPKINVKDDRELKKCMEVCPKNVFEKDGNKIKIKAPENCNICLRCTEICESVEVKGNKEDFILNLESVCGLNAQDLLLKTMEVLENKTEAFKSEIQKVL